MCREYWNVYSKNGIVWTLQIRALGKRIENGFKTDLAKTVSCKRCLNVNVVSFLVTVHTCICSAQFANVRNFEIVLLKLEIAKLLTNFKMAQPSLRDFKIALRKLEIAKLHNAISKVDVYSNIKRTCTFP